MGYTHGTNKDSETRICTKCNRELPNTNEYFGYAKKKQGRLKSVCKECEKRIQKENRERIKINNSNKTLFYEGTRHCKKCNRDLPNNKLYFPVDLGCVDGLRNICRECDKSYGNFLPDNYVESEKWTDEDLKLLESIYKDYTNSEIQEKYFPNRTLRSLESISSKYGFNHKSEETLKRSAMIGAKNNPHCKPGWNYTDEQRIHASIAQSKRYENPAEREIARKNAIARGAWVGEKHPIHINPLYGEKNGRWKGGASELIEQLRRDILDWKKNSSKFCDYKCIFTGGRFQNIHHIISFNSLVDEAFATTCLNRRTKVSDYSTQEYDELKACLIELHNQTFFGACLCKELHELFHKEYTYYDSTIDDFIDFTNKIIDGYYDNYFVENNLSKEINYKYIDYLKSTASSEVSA